MPKYVIAYLGGKQMPNPQDRAAHMARWKAWVVPWSIPGRRWGRASW
jgi:hypothetical protein